VYVYVYVDMYVYVYCNEGIEVEGLFCTLCFSCGLRFVLDGEIYCI